MNVAIYTNILTPYRIYFFDLLYSSFIKKGDKFNVLVMAETESNRCWTYEEYKREYTVLLKHKTISKGNAYIHINEDLKSNLERMNLDILICAGSYLCPGVWQATNWTYMGYKVFFWSESHLYESRKYRGITIKLREMIRKRLYNKFHGFWYAGAMSREFIDKYSKKSDDIGMIYVPNLVNNCMYSQAYNVENKTKDSLRKKYKINKEKINMICPARLSKEKGIVEFMLLLSQSKLRNDIVLYLAGEGEMRNEIEKVARNQSINVVFLGQLSSEILIEYYSVSDFFVLPSISDPNPLSCIEALWAGLPLIISNHCGNHPEVVNQGENGYVFSYDNIEKSQIDIDTILKKEKKWMDKARKISREIAQNRYNPYTVTLEIVEAMHNYLNK